jgi:hypothetical protein
MVQTIAQTTAPTAKRPKRATRAPSAVPSMIIFDFKSIETASPLETYSMLA